MATPRWNPFAEFEDLLNRYNRSLGLSTGPAGEGREVLSKTDWTPAVDITETADAFELKVELPGIPRENVKVNVQDGVLSISGERQLEQEDNDRKRHRIERLYGSFVRSFSLPDNVDEQGIAAEYRDGVLLLTLAKQENARPRAIEVQVQ